MPEEDSQRNGTGMKCACIMATIGCGTLIASGCVMNSTYDAVIAELGTTKAELDSAAAEKQALSLEVKRLEQLTSDMTHEAEAAAAATQQARDEAETERKAAEDRIAKLKRLTAQLTAAQAFLREALESAKEDTRALKSTVETYKSRLGAFDVPRVSSFPSQNAGADRPLQTIPEPPVQTQTSPALPPVPLATMPPPSASDPTPQETPTQPASAQPSPPAKQGWFSSIKGWLLSIWRSVFS